MKKNQGRPRGSSTLLEFGTLESLRQSKRKTAALLDFAWKHYAELAKQRNEKQEQLKSAILSSCRSDFKFERWQRAVKYKYGLHPLSTKGSVNYIGGRFNTGKDVNSEIPYFPALYIAKNKDTALQEHLIPPESGNHELNSREMALTNPASETIVSVSGSLDKVFDLTVTGSLKEFVALIKAFKYSNELISLARKLGYLPPPFITTEAMLVGSLLQENWRDMPMTCDVPANSQIFGHLVSAAGMEGILYPSRYTKEECLAIFPQNFRDTDSFLLLDDEVPHKDVPNRIDGSNCRVCELDIGEISKK